MSIDDQIAVMLAFKAGKKIEVRKKGVNGNWVSTLGDPTWNFKDLDFRVRPEKPQVVFINKGANGFKFGSYFSCPKAAKTFGRKETIGVATKYIQVTPEIEEILTKNGINCNPNAR